MLTTSKEDAMSDQRLRELGREAEELVALPDLGSLQRRGRALRLRRQVAVVGAAAVVATAGVFLFQDRSTDAPQPAPPRSESSTVYPGAQMEDLEAGTYELTPSRDGTEPTVLLTVPEGWNAWEGPNRFDGHRDGDSNEEALARSTWLVGVTVLDVQSVATGRCQPTVGASGIDMPYHQTIKAVREIPGYEATVDKNGGAGLFGHPSTLIRLVPDAAQQECARTSQLFGTDTNGGVGLRGDLDVYVVDVEGLTYVVVANEVGSPPQEVRDELAGILASVEFVQPD
jgi:hypothetical protein